MIDLTPDGAGTLLFLHIPKTGGTSMRRDVGAAYEGSERAFIYQDGSVSGAFTREAFADLPLEERDRFRLVLGHYPYGFHENVPGASAYAAVVRDPIDRVVSVYEHYRHHKGVRFALMSSAARSRDRAALERGRIETERLGLEAWVFERQPREVDNHMVRQIAGAPGTPFGACDEGLLATAMEHVERRFAMLLVQEDLPRSLRHLSDRIGREVRPGRRLKANRRRRSTDSIDPRTRERIGELNRFDQALYDHARARLAEVEAAIR